MKPEYANYFIVRKSDSNTEVLVDFNQTYNCVDLEEGEKRGTLDIYSAPKNVKVSSIVMNISDAKALSDLLSKVLNEIPK